ncbi:MAG: hypothetical protein WC635_17990 [Bacteriovorax sp.]
MGQKLRIEGIYDKRTLRHLKDQGLKDFCFDFSPKSFNFIQEYVFLEQLLSLLGSSDRVFLHFDRSNDPMVAKLINDLTKAGHALDNIFFEFDEWSPESTPLNFSFKYLVNFSKSTDPSKLIGKNFKGFVFDFNFFEELHHSNLLNNFAVNFYTRYHNILNEQNLMLLKIDWNNNLLASLFELFEFNLLSFPINSKIEVCYRNVDLNKLSNEMKVLRKNSFIFQDI